MQIQKLAQEWLNTADFLKEKADALFSAGVQKLALRMLKLSKELRAEALEMLRLLEKDSSRES